jgi:lysophospholipase L1-like esterase
VLLALEFALQVRAQLRTGESVFSLLRGETTFVRHPTLDLRTLRPSAVIRGSKQTLSTNRLGLRDEDFPPAPPPGERRVALLGASTIMGAYAPTNEQTSSAALERLLNTAGGSTVRVVNAGLAGATVRQQTVLMQGMLPGLGIGLVVWYPGLNDIGCSAPAPARAARAIRLPWLTLPKWTLTGDMIVKNTAFLRSSQAASSQSLRPNFDPVAVRAEFERGVQAARESGLGLVLATSATSFRSDMPDAVITQRAASALFFRPCYSGPELARTIDVFNATVREVAALHGVPLIDTARLLAPDPRLFGDATHFSVAGEEAFAAVLASGLRREGLLAPAGTP